MTDMDVRLDGLREALRAAATEDLARAEERPTERRARPSRRLRFALALCLVALAIPAVALATGALSPEEEVAQGLPDGYAMLAGTDPVCATLHEGIEYDCVLTNPPQESPPPAGMERAIGEFIGAPGEWKGVVTSIVDADHHVSGGCRSQNADGTSWRCYLGEASIRHRILGRRKLLGEYLSGPVKW
jgi:hypothetical protein